MANSTTPVIINTYVDDTAPSINFALTREGAGVVDLTGATVDFYIQHPYSKRRTNTGHTACEIVDTLNGKCRYYWLEGDIPVEGIYDANLRIIYQSGQRETAPVAIDVAGVV